MKLRDGLLLMLSGLFFAISPAQAGDYAVVVSSATNERQEWKAVVDALVKKHQAEVFTFDRQVDEALPSLRHSFPRYTCFVATPEEATREFVAQVHQLTRRLDEDPYGDTFWAILTGFDAANARSIAEYAAPLTIKKVASGTEIALEMCQEGVWYDELVQFKTVRKKPGESAAELRGPGDTTRALAETLTDYQADLFVTSGHATERDWMLGFRYRNGFFRSKGGKMFGEDMEKKRFLIQSSNPKVYLPVGNCLMGHVDGPDAMALAWMNSCGVKQMIGYTVPTWFGYAGWGCLDYFLEQPGRYTFSEAFHANQQALIHQLTQAKQAGSNEARGLDFDKDVVALYGDPKWVAKMAPAACAYQQELTVKDDVYTLTVTPGRGADSFKPVNTNGSQRGWRPIIAFLPHRVRAAEVLRGQDLNPLIADDFLLIPNPRECDPQRQYVVSFRAQRRP